MEDFMQELERYLQDHCRALQPRILLAENVHHSAERNAAAVLGIMGRLDSWE